MEADENTLKMALDKREMTESKSEIKAIWLEKLRMESDLQTKFESLQVRDQQQATSIALLEKTKILDHIYIKYGLKLTHLQLAYEQFSLEQDADIKTFINSMNMKQ